MLCRCRMPSSRSSAAPVGPPHTEPREGKRIEIPVCQPRFYPLFAIARDPHLLLIAIASLKDRDTSQQPPVTPTTPESGLRMAEAGPSSLRSPSDTSLSQGASGSILLNPLPASPARPGRRPSIPPTSYTEPGSIRRSSSVAAGSKIKFAPLPERPPELQRRSSITLGVLARKNLLSEQSNGTGGTKGGGVLYMTDSEWDTYKKQYEAKHNDVVDLGQLAKESASKIWNRFRSSSSAASTASSASAATASANGASQSTFSPRIFRRRASEPSSEVISETSEPSPSSPGLDVVEEEPTPAMGGFSISPRAGSPPPRQDSADSSASASASDTASTAPSELGSSLSSTGSSVLSRSAEEKEESPTATLNTSLENLDGLKHYAWAHHSPRGSVDESATPRRLHSPPHHHARLLHDDDDGGEGARTPVLRRRGSQEEFDRLRDHHEADVLGFEQSKFLGPTAR